MPAADKRLWRVTRGCELRWRRWDDEHLVYNCGSGDTHLLDSISAEILKKIGAGPASPAELVVWLSGRTAPDSFPEVSAYIADLLRQLHSLGLIEEVES
jgi:PqqD family protein of HPr-rel-A system